MAKQKFRKVYVIVSDNSVFSKHNYMKVDIYREKKDADRMCEIKQREAMSESSKVYNVNKPIPQYRVHGFYIIHEALF
jgi:hypothetical protein